MDYKLLQIFQEIEEEFEDVDPDDYEVEVDENGRMHYINRPNRPSVLKAYPSRKKGIFVLKGNKLLVAPRGEVPSHSDFFRGQSVRCAGEYRVNDRGILDYLNNKSGHYQPKGECLMSVVRAVRQNGFDGDVKLKIFK